MTVSTTNSVARYLGNGVTRDFPTGFPFGDLTNVGVKLLTDMGAEVDLVYGEDYTVTGGDGATGSVNLAVAPSSLEQIAVYRKTPQTQETDYGSGDPFPSASHEQALDKLTYTVQELQAEVDRSIKVQVTSDTTPDQLIEQLTSDAADAKQAALDSKNEADRAENEADRATSEANRATNEADRAENEADRSKDEADRAYGIVESAKELFEIKPHNGPLDSIQVGFIPAIGQTWFADTYPDAAAGLEAGKQFMVSELLWQTGVTGNPDAYKGCWSSGGTDGSGRRWYRAPKLNADTSYRAPFLRGSQIGVDAGKITDDAIRNFEGSFFGGPDTHLPNGVFKPTGTVTPAYPDNSRLVNSAQIKLDLPASGIPTADENRPRYHGVIMCIRMFGTVSNPGSVDAAQLATDLAIANAKIDVLENKSVEDIGYTIIYPNGGTEASPANVSINSRYVTGNPFPGHAVICQAEVFYNGKWTSVSPSYGSSALHGFAAFQYEDNIVLVSGSTLLSATVTLVPITGLSGNVTTALPCRVKVWKVKGSAT